MEVVPVVVVDELEDEEPQPMQRATQARRIAEKKDLHRLGMMAPRARPSKVIFGGLLLEKDCFGAVGWRDGASGNSGISFLLMQGNEYREVRICEAGYAEHCSFLLAQKESEVSQKSPLSLRRMEGQGGAPASL